MLERGDKTNFLKALTYLNRSRKDVADSDWVLQVLEKNEMHSNTPAMDAIAAYEKESNDPRGLYVAGVLHQAESYNEDKYTEEERKEFNTKAVEHFKKAAAVVYRFAEEAVGGHYFSTNETELARYWYQKGAAQNLGRSQYRSGRLSEDEKQTVAFYEASVVNGSLDAFDKLARIYFDGTGTPRNLKKSIEFAGRAISKESFFFESSKLFSEEFVKLVQAFENDELEDVSLIFELGKTWYWYVYSSWCEREQLSAETKALFYRAMEAYCGWCAQAQIAALYSMWMGRQLGFPKDVARIIAVLVWESRDQPGTAGWHKPNIQNKKKPKLIK
jgi:hypothetical protein